MNSRRTDENAIRTIVTETIQRLNQGDLTVIQEFWDEGADYVGIDGRFLHGRKAIVAFFAQVLKTGLGQETATVEQIRFIAPNLAIVDGSWTITGGQDGKLPAIHGRGCEIVKKKRGRWRFVATREMVLWKSA